MAKQLQHRRRVGAGQPLGFGHGVTPCPKSPPALSSKATSASVGADGQGYGDVGIVSWRSRLPPPLLERLAGVTTRLLLLLPQLEELALFPAALVFRPPPAHHILELAGLDHLTG